MAGFFSGQKTLGYTSDEKLGFLKLLFYFFLLFLFLLEKETRENLLSFTIVPAG